MPTYTKEKPMPMTLQNLDELQRGWAEAEIAADTEALDAIAIEDFMLVGPAGFVLSKQQWLERYRQGDLRTRSLAFEDTTTRVYGNAAVTIGRHVQEAEYRGHPASGEFRATHIAVREGDQWRLAGMHLSPIAGPPPSVAASRS
jgi:ketosteroid isomerase-like protein